MLDGWMNKPHGHCKRCIRSGEEEAQLGRESVRWARNGSSALEPPTGWARKARNVSSSNWLELADESLPRFLKVLDQPFLTWSPWVEFKESVNLDVKKKKTSFIFIHSNCQGSIFFHCKCRQQIESGTVINWMIDLFVSRWGSHWYTKILFMSLTRYFEIMVVIVSASRPCSLVQEYRKWSRPDHKFV